MSPGILVVEDNPITRKIVRVTLENGGYQVHEAPDAATAIAQVTKEVPNLILLDMILPDALGPDLAAQLRRVLGETHCPIVALSGLAGVTEMSPEMAEHFTDFLFKPIEPATLLDYIKAWLPTSERDQQPGRGRRIMVVDDDPAQRKLEQIRLQELGFAVTAAMNGVDALKQVREVLPDVVLTDLLMPEMGGLELCLALRQDPDFAHVPVVVTSSTYADIDEEDRRLAAKAGASTFVVRTPNLQEVVDAVLAALEHTGPAAELSGQGELRSAFTERLTHQLQVQATRHAYIARQAAIAVAQRSILTGVSDVLASRMDLRSALQEILARALDAGDVSVGAVFLFVENGELQLECQQGFNERDLDDLRAFYGHPEVLRRALEASAPVVLPSRESDETERLVLQRTGATAIILMPLLAAGEPHGVLVMASRGDRRPADLLWSSRALGPQLGQAVALARSLTKVAESEQQFRELAETVSEMFFVATPDFKSTLYVSPAFETIWGRGRESAYRSPLIWFESIH